MTVKPIRILVVEDVAPDAELAIAKLREAGYDPDWCRVDSEAEFLAELTPDVDIVLADYSMPGFGAVAVLELVGMRGIDIPVIVVSGSVGEDRAVETMRQGAADYLLKDRLGRLDQAVLQAMERRRLRRTLSETQERLYAVLANAPVAMFLLYASGQIELATGRVLADVARTEDPLVGRSIFDVIAADQGELTAALVTRALGGTVIDVTTRGSTGREYEWRFSPISGGGDLPAHIIAVVVDVTDRVRADVMHQESEAKSELMRMLNHEVRTPLNAILGFAELLTIERKGPLNSEQKRYVDNIHSAGSHLLSLVSDSLDISRIAAGAMDVQMIDLSVDAVVSQAAHQVEPIAAARALALEIEESGLWVRADHRRLLQVLWNLLSNAIKYTPTGGKIWVRAMQEEATGGQVRIEVQDTGVGIPAHERERIFEEFTRLDAGDSVSQEGTGLGLSLTRRLVGLMQGSIGVESAPERGSTFWIRLPAGAGTVTGLARGLD